MVFPLSTQPSYYTQITVGAPNGVFYVGGTVPFCTLSKTPATSGATTCTVRDYWGNVVSTTAMSGSSTTLTPTAPSGGWKPGWYRLYLTGPNTDANYGPAYGSTNFCVIPTDSRFPAFLAPSAPDVDANGNMLQMKAAFGFGTSRCQISNGAYPTIADVNGAGSIAIDQGAADLSATFWNVASSSPFYDPARTRLMWTNFPGQTWDAITLGAMTIYAKDETIDARTLVVRTSAGTTSGTKIVITVETYAGVVTTTETYDNLATDGAANTAINAVSALVKVFGGTTGVTPTGTTQRIAVGVYTTGSITFKALTGVDGSTVTITAVAGTSGGTTTKITINGETYDNLASYTAAVAAINGVSAYVSASGSSASAVSRFSAHVLGTGYFQGVGTAVSALYSHGITRFEGPQNEPDQTGGFTAANCPELAHKMRLFAGAVHAGNSSAKAIGPCFSLVNFAKGGIWDAFLAAGGGSYCDEFATHSYEPGMISHGSEDMNLSRYTLTNWFALLASYGFGSKPVWQTEATNVFINVAGCYHPRRSRTILLKTLLWEQFGVPRERNNVWYDLSHGFWNYPAFINHGDRSTQPYSVMMRTLAAETFGKNHSSILDFGVIGNHVWLGSIYTDPSAGTSVAAIMCSSSIPSASVTLAVTGATGTLTMVDGFGVTSTLTIDANGHVVVPTDDRPVYVRLPSGASVTVYRCNDWPLTSLQPAWGSGAVNRVLQVTSSLPVPSDVNDNQFLSSYGSTTPGVTIGTAALPDSVTMRWPSVTRLDRVLIWCQAWQNMGTLEDFDIQTTVDGTTWVTQTTVTKTDATSFAFGADSNGTGCATETYWDEQWIFDVKLPAPVTCVAIRLYVRATSYGGAPDAAALASGEQGGNPRITIQEIMTMCDDNVNNPRYGAYH